MRPVSERFLRAVRGSHPMSARARVCTTFQTGTAPTGTVIPILAGDVDLDATADVRSTLELTTDGRGMWPDKTNTLLTPYGNEVFLERGVQFGGGTTEWCSLGYYRINAPGQDEAPDGPIRISGSDRMAGIVDARLTAPRQYTSGWTFGNVVADLVEEVYPLATIEWDDTTNLQTIGRTVTAEEDRYQVLKELVTSVGKIFYWDHRGVLVIKDPPDPASPVFDITHGRDGVLVSMSRELSREGVYNAVVAKGEGADDANPVRAVRIDNNPQSPTYWYGTFGKVPRFYASPFITTEAQAASAAEKILRRSLGLPYTVSFGMVPNPALEPLDPVRVSYSDRAGLETHVVETLTVPLTADAVMTGTTREKTVVIVGSV